MAKLSAGLLIYRRANNTVQVLLVHPGGPFWARKDVWGLPKGEYSGEEEPLTAAKREFQEETGLTPPASSYIELGEIKISGGKTILAFAAESDYKVSEIVSNTIFIEWPPRSGRQIEAPEVDRADWKDLAEAVTKMHKGQEKFVERLASKLEVEISPPQLTQGSLF